MGIPKRDAELVAQVLYYSTVGVARLSIALLADALIPLLKKHGYEPDRHTLMRALYRMAERADIEFNQANQSYRLTDQGIRKARSYMIRDLKLPSRPKSWDGKWRIIAFDVPERSRHLRVIFRRKLASLGFRYVQRSLWAYPFPCEEQIGQLAHRLDLEHDIMIFVGTLESDDQQLRKRFKL